MENLPTCLVMLMKPVVEEKRLQSAMLHESNSLEFIKLQHANSTCCEVIDCDRPNKTEENAALTRDEANGYVLANETHIWLFRDAIGPHKTAPNRFCIACDNGAEINNSKSARSIHLLSRPSRVRPRGGS
jgi:hypothetical protein